ncbi:MAG: hypothetical protein NT027_07810 [Proteobacteria bacterium]|nr:hypothetical protein [Pseudomonadota bacterium]
MNYFLLIVFIPFSDIICAQSSNNDLNNDQRSSAPLPAGAESSIKNEANYIVGGPPTKYVWNFSMDFLYLKLIGNNDNNLIGPGARASGGYSYFLDDSFLAQGTINLISGPWGKLKNNCFDGDFSGVGFSAQFIKSFSQVGLRSGNNDLSLGLSLAYADLTGKSVGVNLKSTGNPNSREELLLESKYSIGVQTTSIEIFGLWHKIQKPRPSGNTTELLTTRVEGLALKFGIGRPILAKYRAISTRREDISTSSAGDPKEFIEKSNMQGFYGILGAEIWLGS